MENIKLVSFDLVGTLLDWRSTVERFFPGRAPEFLKLYQQIFQPGYITRQWEAHVLAVARHMDAAQPEVLVAELRQAPIFYDTTSLRFLRRFVNVAFVGEHDASLQTAASPKIGIAVDCSACEIVGPEAWQRLVSEGSSLAQPNEWLHVSSRLSSGLEHARAAGVRTAFVPRPLGSDPIDAESFAPDVMVSDLYQLLEGFVRTHGHPNAVKIEIKAAHARLIRELLRLLRQDHSAASEPMKGLELEIFQIDAETCELIWTSRRALQPQAVADSFRQHLEDKFPMHLLQLTVTEMKHVML